MTELAYMPYLDGFFIYEKYSDVDELMNVDHPEIAQITYTTEVPLTIHARTEDMSHSEYERMMDDVVEYLIDDGTLYGYEDMLVDNNPKAKYTLEMI